MELTLPEVHSVVAVLEDDAEGAALAEVKVIE
jgi:hypothetical protein